MHCKCPGRQRCSGSDDQLFQNTEYADRNVFHDRSQFIDSFNKYSLLIIDDLGIERSSEFALEQVFNVIDSRYRSKKPLIVTTNLTLDELKHSKDLARARIYDRVLERCVPLKINNQNIRELNAAANMQEVRKILNSGT